MIIPTIEEAVAQGSTPGSMRAVLAWHEARVNRASATPEEVQRSKDAIPIMKQRADELAAIQ